MCLYLCSNAEYYIIIIIIIYKIFFDEQIVLKKSHVGNQPGPQPLTPYLDKSCSLHMKTKDQSDRIRASSHSWNPG